MNKYLPVQLFVCAVAMLAVSGGLWQYTSAVENRNIQARTRAMAVALTQDLETTFKYAQEDLLRLVEKLEIDESNGELRPELFELEAELFLRDTPALRTIGWTDENFLLLWQTPKDLYPGSVGRSVANSPERAEYLESVRTEGRAYNTGVFVSDRGTFLIGLHAPLIFNGVFKGVVGGLFEATEYFRLHHQTYDEMHVIVSADLGEIFRSEGAQFDSAHPFYHRREVQVGRSTFYLETIPTDVFVAANRTNLPLTVLGFSLLVGLLIVLLVRDVSERRRAANRYRHLFEGNNDALIIREPVGDGPTQIVDTNDACKELLGYTTEELDALAEKDMLVSSDDLDILNAAVADIKRTGGARDIEVTYMRKDGRPVDVAMSMWRVFDETGNHLQTITSLRDISEQRRAELHLTEAQRIGQIGSWEWDVASQNLYWSQEMYTLLQWDPSLPPPEPRQFDALIHDEDHDSFVRRRDASIDKGITFDDKCRIVMPDGRIKHVRTISKSMLDETGALVRRSGTVQDITDEVEKNANLVESEERFRGLFESNQNGIIIHEKGDGGRPQIIEANQAYLSMIGYTLQELKGLPQNRVLANERDAVLINRATSQLSIKNRTTEFDIELRRKDGSTFEATATIWRVYDDAGNHLQTINAIKDISGQRRMEDRLKVAQRIGQIGSWERDLITDEYSWSSEMYRLFDMEEGQAPLSFLDALPLIHPDDRTALKRSIEEFQREAKPMNLVARLFAYDGGIKFLHFVSHADFFDNNGEQIRRSGTVQDITQQKELEERLNHTERLQALGQLTSGVAHDFNNILGIISNTAQLLDLDFSDDPLTQRHHQRILNAVKRGSGLTDKLLSYSRKQSLKPSDIQTQSFMHEFTAMLGRTLGENIEIDVSLPTESWSVHADENQLTNALLNLALNGRDAMENNGTLTFTVANWTHDGAHNALGLNLAPGDYVAFSVTDTGSGMDEATIKKSMEPFFTTKDVGKGSGLGLSMVYGFAEQSGGNVSIKSEVGFGTVVTLLLPGKQSGTAAPDVEPSTKVLSDSKARRLLIVEDEAELKDVTSQILRRHGYRITAAGNAEEALALAASNEHFDAALLDVVLPGATNGIELSHALREQQPDLKVLFCTGYAAESILSQLEDFEHAGVFRKPLTISEVTDTLNRLFDGSSNTSLQSTADDGKVVHLNPVRNAG